MLRLKYCLIILVVISMSFALIGGCGGSSDSGGDSDPGELAGELDCNDGEDNDGDNEVDCDDFDCILAPNCVDASCEDFLDSVCARSEECNLSTFEECVEVFALVGGLNCDNVISTATQECIEAIEETSCEEFEMGSLPDSCLDIFEIIGLCQVCESDEDCPEDLFCFTCTEDCIGNVNRCAPLGLFAECQDGFFQTFE